MKRVAYFAHTAEVCGPNNNLRQLLARLDHREFEPVIYFPGLGPIVDELRAAGEQCRIVHMGSRQSSTPLYPTFVLDLLRASHQLTEFLHEDKIGLVHTNTCLVPQPAVAALRAGIPLVCHVRESLRRHRLNDAYFGFVLQSADRVIAVSHAVRDDVVDQTAVAAARVDVIYDGLDLSDFDRRRRASGAPPLQETNGTTIIALPAYVLSLKDAEILLAAIASLVHQHALDITLWLIGQEPLEEVGVIEERLKEFCEAHLIAGRVRLLGHRSDLAAVIASADIVCVPSLESDSAANVVLDAMAASRCVIAPESGSIPELIDDGREGILVPLGNVEALTGALARVVSDRGYRQRLGGAARARVERHFTSHRQAQLVQQMYRLVLRSDHKRRGRLPA